MARSRTSATQDQGPEAASGAAALAALASPVRQEIVDTLEALGGEAAVADIAAHLGRSADGLYYHLDVLVAAGVLKEAGAVGDRRGRRYRTNTRGGARVRMRYGRGTGAEPDAVARVVGGLLRTAERDFGRALRGGDATGSGPQRDLWASRVKGWAGPAELREINALLLRLGELLHQPRTARRDRLLACAWVLAPVDDRPLRRETAVAATPARTRLPRRAR